MILLVLTAAVAATGADALPADDVATKQAVARVTNPLAVAREQETVEIPLASLSARFTSEESARLCVTERGQPLLSQLVDADGDGRLESLVFQASFAAGESREFTLATCRREKPKREDYRVYGRFVRERQDDFAWENDRIAFRVYGAALETFVKEPLTSSGVDAWSKGTRRLVINDWYLVDDYHKDHGEGGDFYPAGRTRGCGGSGLIAEGKLRTAHNFRGTRVLASGPIRLVFELSYPVWDEGFAASETKRVTLDAGSHFNRFDSVFGGVAAGTAQPAAGVRIAKGATSRVERERGFVRTWEFQDRYGDGGWLGCAIVADPPNVTGVSEIDGNHVLALRAGNGAATWYAGTAWDRGGEFADAAAWDRYVEAFVQRLGAPLRVEIR
jgi:hypothetical protein